MSHYPISRILMSKNYAIPLIDFDIAKLNYPFFNAVDTVDIIEVFLDHSGLLDHYVWGCVLHYCYTIVLRK